MVQIFEVMTRAPRVIGRNESLRAACDLMDRFRIRHLPVVGTGGIAFAGVVNDRDIKLAAAIAGFDSLDRLRVQDVMDPESYSIRPDAPLDVVAQELAVRPCGCAVICGADRAVIGIFTRGDAARILSRILRGVQATESRLGVA